MGLPSSSGTFICFEYQLISSGYFKNLTDNAESSGSEDIDIAQSSVDFEEFLNLNFNPACLIIEHAAQFMQLYHLCQQWDCSKENKLIGVLRVIDIQNCWGLLFEACKVDNLEIARIALERFGSQQIVSQNALKKGHRKGMTEGERDELRKMLGKLKRKWSMALVWAMWGPFWQNRHRQTAQAALQTNWTTVATRFDPALATLDHIPP